ncbi:uncharacterized protein [Bemisia tabaci]|uniref:uncharacterized protein n=1 Tax=Bemisia tabaci TaxID=7038 RepID=UPI003B284659
MTRSPLSLSHEEPTTRFWNVVLFANGDLGIAPDIWLKEQQNLCAYPRVNAYTLNSLAEKCAPPKKDWPEYKINKFYHRKISSFDKAKELFAEIDSEISGAEESAPPKQAPSTSTTAVSPPSTSPWVATNSAAKTSTVKNLTIATSGPAAKPSSDGNPTVVTSVSSATLSSDGNPTVVTSVSSATTSSDGNPTVVTSLSPPTPSSTRISSQNTPGSAGSSSSP